MAYWKKSIWIFCLLFFTGQLFGHADEQSYIYLNIYQSKIEGRFEATFDDLEAAIGVPLKVGMTLEEVQPYLNEIKNYLKNRVKLSSDLGVHNFEFTSEKLTVAKLGTFLKLYFSLDNDDQIPTSINVEYDAFFDKLPTHQGFALIGHHWLSGIVNNEGVPSIIFNTTHRSDVLKLDRPSKFKGWWNMVKLGRWHIWIGLDHILFLLALVLPSVVRRFKEDNSFVWKPVDKFKSAFWYILKIVTWFTIAHSVTLSLAAFGVINLSSRIVESIIALSIALAAFHNIRPIFGKREWLIALGFGLFHGMGFASVLGEKGLNGEFMFLSLLGFNIGVELGQVVIICLIFPVLFLLRKSPVYPKILFYGSVVLILISIYWFVERFFEVDFIIDDYIGKGFNKLRSLIFG